MNRQRSYQKYKYLLFELVAIIIIGSLVVYLNDWAMNLRSQTFLSSPYFILKAIINPMSYIAFGWGLKGFIALWTPVKTVNCKMTKCIRIVILCLACLIVAVLVPLAVFTVVGDLRAMRYDSVSMSFPYIPVYSELYRSLAIYNMKFAATYLVPGILLYITGFPKKRSKF